MKHEIKKYHVNFVSFPKHFTTYLMYLFKIEGDNQYDLSPRMKKTQSCYLMAFRVTVMLYLEFY